MVARFRELVLVGVALATVFAGGCDSGGSKRDALYNKLVGTWEIRRVQLDRSTVSFSDETLQLEFLTRDDGRSYRLTRTVPGDTSTVTGAISVPESNVLSMTGEFALVWRFDFNEPDDLDDSVRFRLAQASDENVEAFLNAIGLSGSAEVVTMDLFLE